MSAESQCSREIINRALEEGRRKLLEHEAFRLVECYGLPVPRYGLARSSSEAVKIAEEIGYPVVLKIVSPDIVHKSDVGGVLLGVENKEGVVEGYERILKSVKSRAPEAHIVGVLVQKMAPQGLEVIVGATRDPIFDAVVMFGLGGIYVEALRDVSFRVAPLTEYDADEMIREIRGYTLLKGFRNIKPRDIYALREIILGVSRIMVENREVQEIDLNPVMSYPLGEGAIVVDARVILAKPSGKRG